jgi:YD repeat-containing protein
MQTFDYLDRVTALTAPDPTASGTTSYDGYEVSITDAANRTETRTVNAAGQVIQVVDKAGTTMTFAYDPVGNRKQVNKK